jgi:hypothetical protein
MTIDAGDTIMNATTQLKTGSVSHHAAPVRDAAQGLKIRTGIKAGGSTINHNEALGGDGNQRKDLRVQSGVRAGGSLNHNEVIVSDETKGLEVQTGGQTTNHHAAPDRDIDKPQRLKVRTGVKAGGFYNHNEAAARDAEKAQGLEVRTGLKAGAGNFNHNEVIVSDETKGLEVQTGGQTTNHHAAPDREAATGLKVKTGVKAGITVTKPSDIAS